jgi:hypothetical protein
LIAASQPALPAASFASEHNRHASTELVVRSATRLTACGPHVEPAANPRRQIIGQRERIGTANTVGQHDPAGPEVLDARVEAQAVAGRHDSAADDDRRAAALDDVELVRTVDGIEHLAADLTRRLIQPIVREDFELGACASP